MGLKLGGLGTALGAGLGALLALPTGGVSVLAGGALGSAIGGGLGSALDADSETKALNKAQMEQAQAQMSFQERMSNTAHQREVKDLEAAGLNPVLSAGGTGASSGSGAMAILQNPAETRANVLSKAITSAAQIQNMRLTQEMQKTEQSKQALNNTEANKAYWDTVLGFNKAKISDLKTKFMEDNPWTIKTAVVGDSIGGLTSSARDITELLGKLGN